jgi:putative membrane protein
MADREETPAAGSRSETVSAVKDAAVGVVAKLLSAAAVTRDSFVHLAGNATIYELEAAKIALNRSRREDVRRFAQEMQKDHQKMGTELKSFLGGTNSPQSPPDKLDVAFQALIDDLNGASDADFDRRYAAQQQSVHRAAITLFNTYRRHGSDGGLTNLCGLALPVLEHHQKMADELAVKY